MSPVPPSLLSSSLGLLAKRNPAPQDKPTDPDTLIIEGWAQGFMVGSLIIMSAITISNMRRGSLLHKLILIELIFGIWHGFWIFFKSPIYGWWLSVSAIFLNVSWSIHNVVAWLKIKPFLPRYASLIFIGTVILAQPYWVLEIYANFAYFHGINLIFLKTRPYEALCRDPWWIFTTIALFYNIQTKYELKVSEILRISPRFTVMLTAMLLSIVFIVLDVCSVTGALRSSALLTGINPYWKLAYVFKCLTDSVILDDFKTALDRLRAYKISRLGSFSVDTSDMRSRNDGHLERIWDEAAAESKQPMGRSLSPIPSPDGDMLRTGLKPVPENYEFNTSTNQSAKSDDVLKSAEKAHHKGESDHDRPERHCWFALPDPDDAEQSTAGANPHPNESLSPSSPSSPFSNSNTNFSRPTSPGSKPGPKSGHNKHDSAQ